MAKNLESKVNAEDELVALRAKVAQLEAEKAEAAKNNSSVENIYVDEILKMKEKGRSAGEIKYKDIHDHKNVPLFHVNGLRIGKMVGPIHPGNVEDVFMTFKKAGIILSIRKPSEEQIAVYKATPEFKKLEDAFLKKREAKNRSKKTSEVERLTKLISQLSGIPADKLNDIKQPDEVGPAKAKKK